MGRSDHRPWRLLQSLGLLAGVVGLPVAPAQDRQSVVGRVLDAAARPVRGALVTSCAEETSLGSRRAVEVRTDGLSRATLLLVHRPGAALVVSHPTSGLWIGRIDELIHKRLDVRLDPGVELVGRILTRTGRPDATARVRIVSFRSGAAAAGPGTPAAARRDLHLGRTAGCDADGRFVLRVHADWDDRIVLGIAGADGVARDRVVVGARSIEAGRLDLGDLALRWK